MKQKPKRKCTSAKARLERLKANPIRSNTDGDPIAQKLVTIKAIQAMAMFLVDDDTPERHREMFHQFLQPELIRAVVEKYESCDEDEG